MPYFLQIPVHQKVARYGPFGIKQIEYLYVPARTLPCLVMAWEQSEHNVKKTIGTFKTWRKFMRENLPKMKAERDRKIIDR